MMFRFGVVLAMLAAAMTAQERGNVLGVVRDATGKPVAGAAVSLLSRPIPARTDVGDPDLVEVASDARGRFRAAVLRGRVYSAFATLAAGESVRISNGVDGIVPGPVVQLELGEPSPPRRIRIEGLGAWDGAKPLSFSARTKTGSLFERPFELGVDGAGELPPLPGTPAVMVRAADGRVLVFDYGHRTLAAGEERVFAVAALRRIALTVVDEEGRPMVGARVRQVPQPAMGGGFHGMSSTVLGETDAAGRFTAVVPARAFPGFGTAKPLLLLEARGRSSTYLDIGKDDAYRVALEPGSVVVGRLVRGDGKPAGGWPVLLETWVRAVGRPTLRTGFEPPVIRTDADGRFEFWGLNDRGFRLMTVASPAQLRDAGLALPAGRSAAPLAWLAVGQPKGGDKVDLGDLRLDQLAVADVSVKRWDGSPAGGARLLVKGGFGYRSPMEYQVDRVGRLSFPLPSGEFRLEAFVKGGGVAHTSLELAADGAGAAVDRVELPLSQPRLIRGVVVDAEGRPVAGANVMPWNRPKGVDRVLADLAFASHHRARQTDAEGRFEVTVPFGEATFAVKAWKKIATGLLSHDAALVEVNRNGASAPQRLRIALQER